ARRGPRGNLSPRQLRIRPRPARMNSPSPSCHQPTGIVHEFPAAEPVPDGLLAVPGSGAAVARRVPARPTEAPRDGATARPAGLAGAGAGGVEPVPLVDDPLVPGAPRGG